MYVYLVCCISLRFFSFSICICKIIIYIIKGERGREREREREREIEREKKGEWILFTFSNGETTSIKYSFWFQSSLLSWFSLSPSLSLWWCYITFAATHDLISLCYVSASLPLCIFVSFALPFLYIQNSLIRLTN